MPGSTNHILQTNEDADHRNVHNLAQANKNLHISKLINIKSKFFRLSHTALYTQHGAVDLFYQTPYRQVFKLHTLHLPHPPCNQMQIQTSYQHDQPSHISEKPLQFRLTCIIYKITTKDGLLSNPESLFYIKHTSLVNNNNASAHASS